MRDQVYAEEVLREWSRRRLEEQARLREELRSPSGHASLVDRLRRMLGRPAPADQSAAARPSNAVPALRLQDIPAASAPFIERDQTIVDALRLLNGSGAPALLTTDRGRPAVVTRADLDLVLPSPASSLARYEIPALLARVKVAEAVRGPAPVVSRHDSVAKAIAMMGEWDWRPLVVTDGGRPQGVVTAGMLLAALVRQGGWA